MPYFAYFKSYDLPYSAISWFLQRVILHISEQKSCQVKVEKCSTQNFSSRFSAIVSSKTFHILPLHEPKEQQD